MRELSVALDAVISDEFIFGLLVGLVLYGIGRSSPRISSRTGTALLSVTGSTLILVHIYVGRRLWLDLALTAVAMGAYVGRRSKLGSTIAGGIVAYSVVARTGIDLPTAVAGIGTVLLVILPQCLTSISTRMQEVGGMRAAALTAVGIWATVPDTNIPRVLLGATIGVTAVRLAGKAARVDPMIVGVWIVTVTWVGMQGGEARPASVVGAWGSLGMLVVPGPPLPPWLGLAAHAGIVLVSSRIAGLGSSTPTALVITGTALALGGALRHLRGRLPCVRFPT